jgi:hypothetical protein
LGNWIAKVSIVIIIILNVDCQYPVYAWDSKMTMTWFWPSKFTGRQGRYVYRKLEYNKYDGCQRRSLHESIKKDSNMSA